MDGVNGAGLYVAKFAPSLLTYPFLDGSGQLVEGRGHGTPSELETDEIIVARGPRAGLIIHVLEVFASILSIRSLHSTPGFCSMIDSMFTKAVTVFRGVRKYASPIRSEQCAMNASSASSGRASSSPCMTRRTFESRTNISSGVRLARRITGPDRSTRPSRAKVFSASRDCRAS